MSRPLRPPVVATRVLLFALSTLSLLTWLMATVLPAPVLVPAAPPAPATPATPPAPVVAPAPAAVGDA